MEAYCVKCKTKREIIDPVAEFNARSTPVTKGKCAICGTTLYRMGSTPAHEGMEKPAPKVKERSGKLVIVESPAKAKTVGRFLGKGYVVRASVGHVRDLLRSELSVDVENNFTPKYRVPNEKRVVVKELKALAKDAAQIYLATDPDREGEAIAWHLMEAAQIEPSLSQRVVFHEITENAVNEAFANPREINMDLVDAQQARRVLDRLVGYSISPVLWEKVRSRLSAGRVQSVALRLIVEREREIEAFDPVEYWSIEAELSPENKKSTYVTKLAKIDDKDPELGNKEVTEGYLKDLEGAGFVISKIKRSERRRKPSAPFITSTLQQEASRRLGYTARRTMMVAQQLYEGIDLGDGTVGLITYMRTDSTTVAEVAVKEVRELIKATYGENYLPETPPSYKTRAVSAQEAHEAIRPTSVLRQPDKVKGFLTPEQYKLYLLIWQRFVSSQMESAIYDTLSVDVNAEGKKHKYIFRASGSTVKFPGFLILYEETLDEDQKSQEPENIKIPAGLEEGQKQRMVGLIPEQHFTQPPPRFTEATLVQVLEEFGIGRPSTYAPILSTIQQRGYVMREAKRLFPTETGILVNDLVVNHFPDIVDLKFTANMESELDEVAGGKTDWRKVIGEFYTKFEPTVKKAIAEMPVSKSEPEKIGRLCTDCGQDLVIRWGRYGKFISCSSFPTCRHTEALLEKIGVTCPNDGGDLVLRKTRKGRIFYACSNYPKCDFTNWKRPIAKPCPKCGGLLVIANKKEVQCTKCEEFFLMEQIGEVNLE